MLRTRCVFGEVCIVFLVRAEDGIRDLVRSRGLGDVYKRQHRITPIVGLDLLLEGRLRVDIRIDRESAVPVYMPVSYTHLTLPTSDLV